MNFKYTNSTVRSFENTIKIPLISIITPACNRKDLLAEMVASIRSQSFTSWEIIVVDDGSTDGTGQYAKGLADPRIRHVSRPEITQQKGGPVCRNIGIRHAKGKYIIFLDSDDVLLPGCLENRFAVMENQPDLDFAVFWAVRFKKDPNEPGSSVWGSQTATGNELDDFLQHNILWQTTGPIWRRDSLLKKQGYWDERFTCAQDYEYHIRALCKGLRHINTGSVDFGWRISDELSMSSFDAFKRRYASGDYIFVFDVIVNLLKKYHLLTSPRKKTIKKEVIRLGVQVRLNGGRAALVTKALLIAKDAGALTPVEFIELKIVFSLWFRVLGKIPAMSYLARRFKVQEVHGS